MQAISRNAPCVCGSGKKFKKCCLGKDTANQEQYGTYRALVKKILDFISQKREFADEVGIAVDTFFGDRENLAVVDSRDEETQGFFNEWLAFDYVLNFNEEGGIRFIDLFIREEWNRLSDQERAIVESLKDSSRTIVEVQSVRQGEGVGVKDLFSQKIYFVHELRGSHELVIWDCLFVRLYKDEGKYHFSGSMKIIPRDDIAPLVGLIKETAKTAFSETGDLQKKFLKTYGYILIREVLECTSDTKMPAMVTTTGEPFVFCTLRYAVYRYKDVFAFLKGRFEEAESKNSKECIFYCLNKEDTIIASFTLTPQTLEVETKSVKRSEKIKKLLCKYCDESLKLEKFTQKSLEEAFEEAKDDFKQNRPHQTPDEVYDKDFEEAIFKRTYGNWEKAPIPLLNDMTPLEAMKGKKGRMLLAELFKIYENYEQRSQKQGTIFTSINIVQRLKEKIHYPA